MYFGQEVFFSPGSNESDASLGYFYVVGFFEGRTAEYYEAIPRGEQCGGRPTVHFLVSLLTPRANIHTAYGIINTLFWIGAAILVYLFFTKFFKSRNRGFISAVLFTFSLPLIAYGSRALTDMVSWFFIIALIYYYEIKVKTYSFKELFGLSILFAVALLSKESSLFFVLYVGLDLLIKHRKRIGELIKRGLKFCAVFIAAVIPSMLWQRFLDLSWFKQRSEQVNYLSLTIKGPLILLTRSFFAFHLLWLPVIIGLFAKKEKKHTHFLIKAGLSTAFPLIYGWLLAPPFSPRFTFFMFPFVIASAVIGLDCIAKWVKQRGFLKKENAVFLIFIIIYAIISFFGASLFPTNSVRDGQMSLFDAVIKEFQYKYL